MQEEKQGAEFVAEQATLKAQQAADLEHLLKNVHPSLRDSVSTGDKSDGTTQTLSDYSVTIFNAKLNALQEQLDALSAKVEELRLQVVPSATPETPAEVFLAPEPETARAASLLVEATYQGRERDTLSPTPEPTIEELQIGTPLVERTTAPFVVPVGTVHPMASPLIVPEEIAPEVSAETEGE